VTVETGICPGCFNEIELVRAYECARRHDPTQVIRLHCIDGKKCPGSGLLPTDMSPEHINFAFEQTGERQGGVCPYCGRPCKTDEQGYIIWNETDLRTISYVEHGRECARIIRHPAHNKIPAITSEVNPLGNANTNVSIYPFAITPPSAQ